MREPGWTAFGVEAAWRRLRPLTPVVVLVMLASMVALPPRAGAAVAAEVAQQPPAACPESRPDRTSAIVAARLCDGRVRVDSLTSETTEVWANADGRMSAEVHSGQVRVRDGENGWRMVDLNLARRADGSVAPRVHPNGLVLSGARGSGVHDLARLGSGDEQLTLGWRGTLPQPVLSGPKATYMDVRPGVDLIVEATRYGFETFLIVKNRAAAAQVGSVALPWRTGKLTSRTTSRGGLELRNAKGAVRAQVDEAFMWDARIDPKSGEPVRKAAVGLVTRAAGRGETDLVLTPDAAFLADPATVYPVVIDPVWDIGPVNGNHDTWVENTGGTGWNSTELKLGTWNGGGQVARSFIFWDLAPFFGTHVMSATLHLYETWAFSCRDAEWQVWISEYFDHTTNWWNQPPWHQYQSSSWQTTGYDSCESDGWVDIDARGFFQHGADGYYPYYTMGLKAALEWHSDSWKRFRSANSTYGDPYVTIDFSYRPTVANLVTVPATSGCVTGPGRPWMTSRTPRLSATVSDADGQPSSVTFEWGIVGGSMTSQAVSGVPSGAVASVAVPTGAQLAEGGTYAWRVSATDSVGAASGWSGWCEFTVDTTKPGVPFVSSPQYPEHGRGTAASGTFTFTPAPGNTDVASFTYQMDTDTSAATVNGTGPTSVTITPSAEGTRTLTVRAKDHAGNISDPKHYVFDVGRAGIAQPRPGAIAITRMKIALDVADPTLTRATFGYRRGPGGTELDIPLANLRKADGSPITTDPVTLSTLGGYAIWNAADTLGSAGGVVQVRAVLYPDGGGASYTTAWVTATVDSDGDVAAATSVGPGSVNLLTGDYTLSSSDVDELGLSVGRVASSRKPTDGWLPQGQRLTVNQQQVGTDTTGFGNGGTSTLARSTVLGQASSTDSLEVTPTRADGDTYADLGCNNGSLCNGMQPGKRYRMSGWIYVPAATGLNGVFPNRDLRIVGFYRLGGVYYEIASPKAAWTGAWQELSVDMAVPDGATEAFFRLYNGMAGGSGKKVFYDNLSLREVVAPFGPSWRGGVADGVAGNEFVSVDFPVPDLARVVTAGGDEISFAKGGGAFFPQPGAESLTLTYTAAADRYDLTDLDGTVVRFTKPAGASAYMVSETWTTDAHSTTSYVYTSTDNRTLIHRVANPTEPGVTNCTVPAPAVPGRGCEVLEYVYATSTTATPTSLGDVKDQVSAVKVWTWDQDANGGAGAMTAVETARYRYDNLDRLREVWDPRVPAPLITTYEYDAAGRVTSAAAAGELPWLFDYGTIAADSNPGRLHRVRRPALQQGYPTTVDGEIATRIVYQVPLTRSDGGPHEMNHAAITTWAQTDLPTDATAVFGPEDDPLVVQATASTPGADGYRYATVHYLNASAQEINTATPHPAGVPGASIDTVQYDKFGNTVWTLQATNRLLALGQLPNATTILTELNLSSLDTAGRAQALASINAYSADGMDLLQSTGPTIKLVLEQPLADPDGAGPLPALPAGSTVIGRSHTVNVYDEGKPDGANYHLLTTSSQGASVAGYADADVRVTKTGYNPDNGSVSGWVLKKPTKIIADAAPGGANLTSYVVYDSAGRATASWGVGSTGNDARATRTIYYTGDGSSPEADCRNKPEWAGQPCLTRKAGPVSGHDPARMSTNLPERRVTDYSRWGDVEIVTETVPGTSASRTTTTGYDTAGRTTSVEITSTGDGATQLPAITTQYSATTGQVTTTMSGGSTITRAYDQLGRLHSYTDANSGVTVNEFDRYGKPTKVSDPTGHATFSYDRAAEPRGLLTSVTDSIAGQFRAEYSADGQLTVLHYPNGMTRTDTLDANLQPVQRSYARDSDSAVIYTESVVTNSAGEKVTHTFTGGSRNYRYDPLGRLDRVTDSVDAEGCTVRTYGYDSRTNRTFRKTFNPDAGGACKDPASATPDAQTNHAYDTGDRITDAGYTYDPFGRITATPGGMANAFYANDLVQRQTLGTDRQTWTLDPNHRLRAFTTEAYVDGNWVNATSKLNHYGDDSDEPRWIIEDTTLGSLTRMVSGPDGDLAATTSATGDAAFQLVNLHGDVVTTVDSSAMPAGFQRFDEFGVAADGQADARYGWLGGKQRSAEALGDVILMGVRLYHPNTGRFLQSDPVDGGSATAYDYCNADPINCLDLDGRWGIKLPSLSSIKNAVTVVAKVASVASMIPGPIGTIAGVVSAGAYAATGNWKEAAWAMAGAAAAVVGAGAAVKLAKVAVTAVRASRVTKAAAPIGKAARGASCPLRNSFAPETPVKLASGAHVPISDITTGEYVVAVDPITGTETAQPVLNVIVGYGAKHLVEIDLDGDTSTSLTATAGHPIWVIGTGWTDAINVRAGDSLLTDSGSMVAVQSVRDRGSVVEQTVFNLNVGNVHTYVVGVDDEDVVVHNCGTNPFKRFGNWVRDKVRKGSDGKSDINEVADVAGNVGEALAGRGPLTQLSTAAVLVFGRRVVNRLFGNIWKVGKEMDKPRNVPNRGDRRRQR